MPVNFQRSQIILVVLLATLVAGLALSAVDLLEYQEGLASYDWLPVKGKILTTSIRTDRTWMSNKMIFIPSASYSYHITDDEVLRGNRLTFPDHIAAPEKDLKALLRRLQISNEVTSYYDPKNHSHVTMVRGVRHAKYCVLFLRDAAISLLSGLLALSFWLRQRKK
jgi:Protein of unknown function (DUF3592)